MTPDLTTTIAEQIADLEVLLGKGMPRPWGRNIGVTYDGIVRTCVFTYDDHALIVAAINALPALISALRAAPSEIEGRTAGEASASDEIFRAVLDWGSERGLFDPIDYPDGYTADEIVERLTDHETECLRAAPTPPSGGAPGREEQLEDIDKRLSDNTRLEQFIYEIFYANPIAFARKNLVIALQRHLRGQPLSTPEEDQLKFLDTLEPEERALWWRAENARRLNEAPTAPKEGKS